MSQVVTIAKNWKKKIDYVCGHVHEIRCYSLDNGFSGAPIKFEGATELRDFVIKELNTFNFVKLRYNKENGDLQLSVHSNLWYEWNKKIDW